jgi:hypothetical protein
VTLFPYTTLFRSGLSLVAAVARLHEATLTLADNNPGLKATISFRRSAMKKVG